LFELPATKPTQKFQYLPHCSSENYEINSIKSDSPRAFQKQQQQQHDEECSQISINFFIFNFI
jgi:hypothetical protein